MFLPGSVAGGLDKVEETILDSPVPLSDTIFMAANEVVSMDVKGSITSGASQDWGGEKRKTQVEAEEAAEVC